jgi:CRISPR-associated protein Cas5d
MEIAGSTAMWTRPDTGDCPVSNPAPTYSAVKAIFESILWGPAIEIIPVKVEICAPIKYHSYTTNYGGPLRSATSVKDKSSYQLLATVLIDVCYKLYSDVCINPHKRRLPESALRWDTKTTSPGHAYQDIFNRRLYLGQCYSIPSLGWREFTPSYFGPLRKKTKVLSSMQDIIIPSMLREVFGGGYNTQVSYIYDQNVKIVAGCLQYADRGIPYVE